MKQVFGFRGTWQRLKDGARLVCLIGFYLGFFFFLVSFLFVWFVWFLFARFLFKEGM